MKALYDAMTETARQLKETQSSIDSVIAWALGNRGIDINNPEHMKRVIYERRDPWRMTSEDRVYIIDDSGDRVLVATVELSIGAKAHMTLKLH